MYEEKMFIPLFMPANISNATDCFRVWLWGTSKKQIAQMCVAVDGMV
jgi:hypothetical protein